MQNIILEFDKVLRTLTGVTTTTSTNPANKYLEDQIKNDKRACNKAIALMRVNHVGEVCAQAMYQAQRLSINFAIFFAKNRAVSIKKYSNIEKQFAEAAKEEERHLVWCKQRLDELQGRVSLLNPLWYFGSFICGLSAGVFGSSVSLGFVKETEDQVASHLKEHLARLPKNDLRSIAIVKQMYLDEIEHAHNAIITGATELILPVRLAMHAAAKCMTTIAYYI